MTFDIISCEEKEYEDKKICSIELVKMTKMTIDEDRLVYVKKLVYN